MASRIAQWRRRHVRRLIATVATGGIAGALLWGGVPIEWGGVEINWK